MTSAETDTTSQNDDALGPLTARYLAAVLGGQRREALRLLIEEGYQRGLSVETLQLGVIQPTQREIGRLWQENRISIAIEHQATAISQLALAHLFPLTTREAATGKQVLVACVEGELHDLGARVCGDILDAHGFDVRMLGANVPLESLLHIIAETKPDLVALSVTMPFHLGSAQKSVRAIQAAFPPSSQGPKVAVGGIGIQGHEGLARTWGVQIFGADARELVHAARQSLGLVE